MKIQNAPLTIEQQQRIQRLILDINNRSACSQGTGIAPITIAAIAKRGWGRPEHIKLLMEFCDTVEGLCTNNNAD